MSIYIDNVQFQTTIRYHLRIQAGAVYTMTLRCIATHTSCRHFFSRQHRLTDFFLANTSEKDVAGDAISLSPTSITRITTISDTNLVLY